MKFILFFIISICVANIVLAQSPGKIKGRVLDSASREPIAYATVTVFLNGSSTVAGGIITADDGTFSIDNLAAGIYNAKAEFIGYKPVILNNIHLTADHLTKNMGDVLLASNSKMLNDVTVTGERNYMENQLDKFVYNVEKDVTSQGGVATDVLRKVPQVSIDVDGNVELLGSSNIRVFVNGKPSTMFDNNLADALAAIPASQIKSIEVITTPGAQYDAQGTGGIINIILKDNKAKGINGTVAASGGTRLENGSANIHARKGKIDIGASVSGNAQLRGTTLNSMDRTSHNDSAALLQNGNGQLEKTGYRGQLGLDYAITKKQSLSASASFSNTSSVTNGITRQQSFDFLPYSDTAIVRNSYNTTSFNNVDWNINYSKKFDREGQELDLSCQSSTVRGNTWYQQQQRDSAMALLLNGAEGNNRLHDVETYVTADYAQPLTKNTVLNMGVKGSFSRISSFSDHYVLDPANEQYNYDSSQLNNFNYYRDVYAAYVSSTFPLFEAYSLKLGVRDEYTRIWTPGDTISIPSYNSFIPSAVISDKLSDNQTLKVSYTKRIQRAGYRQLNPFIDATDPTNLLQGYPYLKPERSDVAELSYYQFFKKGGSILVTLFYRSTLDDEQSYILSEDSLRVGNTLYRDVTITTNRNAGHQQLTGFNISGSAKVGKLELRGNANIFDKYIVSELVPGNSINSLNYRINANATYEFSKTLVAELFGNFNSARTEIQGKFPSFTTYSFAIRKMFLKNKASIAFTTTDPFNEYVNQPTDVAGPGFAVYSVRKIPYRSFGLSLTYKFGKMEFKEKKQEKESNGDDSGL